MTDPAETPLPRRFVLYFPLECRGADQLLSPVEGILCERLGGVTSYPARGTFKMADGQRISEELQVLESFCESGDWAEQKPFLLALAGMIGAILRQESIACAIEGRIEIVTPIGLTAPPPQDIGQIPAAYASRTFSNLAEDLVFRPHLTRGHRGVPPVAPPYHTERSHLEFINNRLGVVIGSRSIR